MARIRPLVLLSERAKYTSARPTHRRRSDATDAKAGYPVYGIDPVRPTPNHGQRKGTSVDGKHPRPILDRNPKPVCDTCGETKTRRTATEKRVGAPRLVRIVNRSQFYIRDRAKVRVKSWVCITCESITNRLQMMALRNSVGAA